MTESAEHQSPSSNTAAETSDDPTGPSLPLPLKPPPPTIWPFVAAVGMMVIFWGFLLDLIVVGAGVGLFLIGMVGLVGDWVREHRNQTT